MKRETKREATHNRASEDMAMVKVSKGLDDEFSGKVLNGDLHIRGRTLGSRGRR